MGVADIIARLSEPQKQWLISMEPKLGKQAREYETLFHVQPSIDLTPAKYCDDTGFLLAPANRVWFGGHGCKCDGFTAWSSLNETGLAVREALMEMNDG
jgi:hypothetical protein